TAVWVRFIDAADHLFFIVFFFFQAEDGIRDFHVTGVQTCALPILMSVSMVVAPWRRLAQVARWKGQAPHTTTGEVRAKASHCQCWNCRAGTIDSTSTGRASAAVTSRRWRACSSG